MSGFSVDEALSRIYGSHYLAADERWRRIGATGKAANIISLARAVPHSTILEIGAGDGAVLQRLEELGFGERYWALEISPSGLEAIRARSMRNLEECRLFDGYEVPYERAAFDLVVLSHVLEHVEYPRKLLYEATRVAGAVLVEVPLEDNLRLGQGFVWDEVGHINWYSPKTIRRLLQTCGLEILGEKLTNPPLAAYEYRHGRSAGARFWIKQGLLRAWPALAVRLFTYHVCLLATPRRRIESPSAATASLDREIRQSLGPAEASAPPAAPTAAPPAPAPPRTTGSRRG